METLVAGDEFVGEGESWHEAPFLEPEDGAKASGEEDSLNAGKCDDALGEGVGRVDPAEGPVGLLGDTGNGVNGVKETAFLYGVFYVGFEEEAVHLGVNVLDGDLEAVKGAGLGDLDLLHKTAGEVFEYDAVGGGEEGKDVGDEMALAVGESVPMADVLREIDLLRRPERGFCFLVHFPDLGVLDREHAETIRVRGQERLFGN